MIPSASKDYIISLYYIIEMSVAHFSNIKVLLVNDCQNNLGRGEIIIIIRSIIINYYYCNNNSSGCVGTWFLHQPSDRWMAFLAARSDVSPCNEMYLLQMKALILRKYARVSNQTANSVFLTKCTPVSRCGVYANWSKTAIRTTSWVPHRARRSLASEAGLQEMYTITWDINADKATNSGRNVSNVC